MFGDDRPITNPSVRVGVESITNRIDSGTSEQLADAISKCSESETPDFKVLDAVIDGMRDASEKMEAIWIVIVKAPQLLARKHVKLLLEGLNAESSETRALAMQYLSEAAEKREDLLLTKDVARIAEIISSAETEKGSPLFAYGLKFLEKITSPQKFNARILNALAGTALESSDAQSLAILRLIERIAKEKRELMARGLEAKLRKIIERKPDCCKVVAQGILLSRSTGRNESGTFDFKARRSAGAGRRGRCARRMESRMMKV